MEKENANNRLFFWTWLRREKDSIIALATIFQAIAVLVGVIVIVNEFVVKDRQAHESRVERALEIFRGQSGFDGHLNLGDLIFEVIGANDTDALKKKYFKEEKEFVAAIAKAIRRYTEIQSCLKTNTCDDELVNHLFCTEALQDSFVAYKLVIKPLGWETPSYDARLDNLFDFTLNCLRQGRIGIEEPNWKDRRSGEWDSTLGTVFSRMDKRWQQAEEMVNSRTDEQ